MNNNRPLCPVPLHTSKAKGPKPLNNFHRQQISEFVEGLEKQNEFLRNHIMVVDPFVRKITQDVQAIIEQESEYKKSVYSPSDIRLEQESPLNLSYSSKCSVISEIDESEYSSSSSES
jgi:hypothetical protein